MSTSTPQSAQVSGYDVSAGLTSTEAEARRRLHGPNLVSKAPRDPVWRKVLHAVGDPLVLVLLGAAVLTIAIRDLADTAVILLVVAVNSTVAVWQEVRADRAVEALTRMAAPTTRLVRDGRERVLPAAEVVPGDVLVLAEGDVVPADAVVVEAVGLLVDESSLSGESVPVDKDATGSDQVMAGTTVVHGRGRVVVTSTGDSSALGRIATLLQGAGVDTPMQRRMKQLSTLLALAVLALCVVVMVLGLARGQSLELMGLTAITLAVAAVPESLPVVVSLSLALAARRMARRHAIVRTLTAVETLGSVTVLATDKTGTLTEGTMSVAQSWTAPGVSADRLWRAATLCNDAHLDDVDGNAGDPTEVALLAAARSAGVTRESLQHWGARVAEEPFDSVRKTMSATYENAERRSLTVVKGAPEKVVVDLRLTAGAEVDDATSRAHAWAAQGLRVLALADDDAGGGLGLLGLVALQDPPRAAAVDAVAACRSAGIRLVLVTGDHAATAASVAAQVGFEDGPAIDLSRLDGRELADVVDRTVLARATPEQKLEAVRLWQADGQVVAMTGDGVNDGPALRRADIGVAMGRRGTEVARQAADLILADDDLSSVVAAVEEGRRVYTNVRRFLLYGLSGGAAEILVMLLGPFVGIAVPLLPAQILWVNLLTHSLAGTALGAEPVEPGSMSRPPRDPAEGVLGSGLWWRILLLSGVLTLVSLVAGTLVAGSGSDEQTRSAILLVLGVGQLGVAMGAGTRRGWGLRHNPALPVTVVAAALLLVAALTLPVLQGLLGTAAVPTAAWWAAAGGAAAGWVGARLLTRRGPSTVTPDHEPGRGEAAWPR